MCQGLRSLKFFACSAQDPFSADRYPLVSLSFCLPPQGLSRFYFPATEFRSRFLSPPPAFGVPLSVLCGLVFLRVLPVLRSCVLVSLNRPTAGLLSPFPLLRWTGNLSHSGSNFSFGGQGSAKAFAREAGGSQVARCATSLSVIELFFSSVAGSLDFCSARRCVCRSSVLRCVLHCVVRSFGRSLIFGDFHVPLISMAKARFLRIIFPCH
jgi:hypothetical protein